MRHRPSARDRLRIAERSGSGIRSVDRVYAGATVRDTTRERVTRVAAELGLPLPPQAPTEGDI